MNALFVASRYLSRDQKVILIDSRARVGGMWVDTYPYVRLHQPYGLFTAGDIEWTLGKKRSHLASKGEVLDHFQHCLDVIKQRVQVDEYFGWTFESHDENAGSVRITCRSADGRPLVVEAKRLIKAYEFRVTPNDPLKLSSARVQSVSPDFCDMRSGDMRRSGAPVWIIGGGKTAMDTAHTLITEYPGREVNLVAGAGTFFGSRDVFFPAGARRWWKGSPPAAIATKLSKRFDGTNEVDVANWYRGEYCTWLTPDPTRYFLGFLSESENATIAAGLNHIITDHLSDVIDRNDQTELLFRSGATKAIQPCSWIVNCTGYLARDYHPYEPYLSDGGAVVSIQFRSTTMHLSSFQAYFLTHLLFLGRLADVPLYEVDMQELQSKSRAALPYTVLTLAQHNLSVISDVVPKQVFLDCGLDFNRWYPLPRRMITATKFVLTHRRQRENARRTLDTIRERFDIRCGLLPR